MCTELSVYWHKRIIVNKRVSHGHVYALIGRDKFLTEFFPVQDINPFLVYVTNCHIVQAFLLHAVVKPGLQPSQCAETPSVTV